MITYIFLENPLTSNKIPDLSKKAIDNLLQILYHIYSKNSNAAQKGRINKMGKVIAVANQKGGVRKNNNIC